MRKTTFLSVVALLAMGFSMASAQDVYVTGTVVTPNWEPGNGRFLDNEQSSTVIPDTDGLLNQLVVAGSNHGLTEGDFYQYKYAGAGWNPEYPDAGDSWLIAPSDTEDIIFYLDRVAKDDGFVPNNRIAYTSLTESIITSANTVAIAGSFYEDLLGEAERNWNPAGAWNIELTDAGSGEAGDGFFGVTLTDMPVGNWGFAIVLDGDTHEWERKIGPQGMNSSGDLSLTVLDASDTITILLDLETARTSVANDNPLLNPGPPFFAHFYDESGANLSGFTGFESNLELIDNGDYFARLFTIPTAGNYSVDVRQYVGRKFPNTGVGYPFTTTVDNQEIVVIFDRAEYTDGYQPATDFVVVLGEEATGQRSFLNSFSYVQPVGNFQMAFGGTDWNPDQSGLQIFDNGTAPDTVAGDLIFSGQFTAFDGSLAQARLKAVLRRTGVQADMDDAWNVQAGGDLDGLTVDGDNSTDGARFDVVMDSVYVFKVDAVTGRVGAADAAAKTLSDPDRSAEYFDAQTGNLEPTNVNDWLLF